MSEAIAQLSKPIPPAFVDRLVAIFECALFTNAVREHQGASESYYPMLLSDAVVFPRSTEEVVELVNLCGQFEAPLTLGIITEITLRLHPIPEAISAATCCLTTLDGADPTVA